MIALDAFLQVGLGVSRMLGTVGRQMRLERARYKGLGHIPATIEVEGTHKRLIHVFEGGVEATRPPCPSRTHQR